MLKGTLIEMEPGKYGFECISHNMTKPEQVRHIWRIDDVTQARGNLAWANVLEAVGKEATLRESRVDVYCGHGAYITGFVSSKADIVEITPVPKPPVRAHVQVRWHHDGYRGYWQKYLKSKGWVQA